MNLFMFLVTHCSHISLFVLYTFLTAMLLIQCVCAFMCLNFLVYIFFPHSVQAVFPLFLFYVFFLLYIFNLLHNFLCLLSLLLFTYFFFSFLPTNPPHPTYLTTILLIQCVCVFVCMNFLVYIFFPHSVQAVFHLFLFHLFFL